VRAYAARRADGRPEFAGIAFGGPTTRVATTHPVAPPSPVAPVAATDPATAPDAPAAPLPAIRLEALRVTDVSLTFTDKAVAGTSPLTLSLDRVLVRDFDTRGRQPAVIEIRGRAPGLAANFAADGTADLVAPQQSFMLALRADGITPTALDPYLGGFGLRRKLENATFTGTLGAAVRQEPAGGLHAGLTLADLALRQGEVDLINLKTVQIDDLYVGPALSAIRLGRTRVSGPRWRSNAIATTRSKPSATSLTPP
jgi:hypothetical protein